MFGYVRPVRPELKCRDFDLYRAAYCGLCRTLGQRYGPHAPLTLNFDFTFLTLLLYPPEEAPVPCPGHCRGNPLRKKAMLPASPALEAAADAGILFTWWKLRDTAVDEGSWKRLGAQGAELALRGAYRLAAQRRPLLDGAVSQALEELAELEREGCASLDRPADAFARALRAAAPPTGDGGRDRALDQLLYHLGRWIYLLDAQDDLADDVKTGRYNPILARFGPEGEPETLERTLSHSRNLIGAAFQLENFGCRGALLENILYLGLPLVQRAVFDGSWKQLKKQRIWGSDA